MTPHLTLFGGTPDSGKWYLIQWKVPDFMNAGMNMQISKYSSMQVYRYANIQVWRYESMQIYKYTS